MIFNHYLALCEKDEAKIDEKEEIQMEIDENRKSNNKLRIRSIQKRVHQCMTTLTFCQNPALFVRLL